MSRVSLTEERAAEVILDILSSSGHFSPANLRTIFMEEVGIVSLFDEALESLVDGRMVTRTSTTRNLLFIP